MLGVADLLIDNLALHARRYPDILWGIHRHGGVKSAELGPADHYFARWYWPDITSAIKIEGARTLNGQWTVRRIQPPAIDSKGRRLTSCSGTCRAQVQPCPILAHRYPAWRIMAGIGH